MPIFSLLPAMLSVVAGASSSFMPLLFVSICAVSSISTANATDTSGSPLARKWDHSITIDAPCSSIWNVIKDYESLVKIAFPDTEPTTVRRSMALDGLSATGDILSETILDMRFEIAETMLAFRREAMKLGIFEGEDGIGEIFDAVRGLLTEPYLSPENETAIFELADGLVEIYIEFLMEVLILAESFDSSKVGDAVEFYLRGPFQRDFISEQLIIVDHEEQYLSFVLTAGFDYFQTYRGEWFLKNDNDNDNDDSCEFHKGSIFLINPDGPFTIEAYEISINEQLERVKDYFEDPLLSIIQIAIIQTKIDELERKINFKLYRPNKLSEEEKKENEEL